MFANYFHQTFNYFKQQSTTTSNVIQTMSNEQSGNYYKIPSTPLKEGNIFTRSQCEGNNKCSANCLEHKKRRRRPKKTNLTDESTNESNNLDLSINSTGSELQIEQRQTDESTSSINSNYNKDKKMPPKRKSTKYSTTLNYAKLSGDDEPEFLDDETEIVQNNVNRYNYYENFSNNLSDTTASFVRQPFVRQFAYPVLIGVLIVFLLSIYFYSTSQQSTSQQNSIIFGLSDDNHTFLRNEEQLNKVADQLKLQNNLRAIETFKQELQHSFGQLNQRISRIENDLQSHRNTQNDINRQLIDNTNKLNDRLIITDNSIVELTKYKVQIDKLISEYSLVQHTELKIKFDDIRHLIIQLIKEALDKYDADKTGIVDYASEFAGGEIISTGCTESYDLKGASYKILGVPIWSPPNIPRFVIQPNTSPGQCWYFSGDKGSLVIKLARTILPSNFSYEHIPVRNAPDGHINSAPKHFEVRALDGPEAENNWLLGEFIYDKHGDSIQFFDFQNTDRPIEYIEFNILSNHGNDEFTCLYRLRVHGLKVDNF